MKPRLFTNLLRWCWPKRLMVQIALLGTLILTLGIAATSLYTVNKLIQQQHRETQTRLSAIGSTLAFASAHFLLLRDQAALEHFLLQTAHYPGLRSLTVINAKQRVVSEIQSEPGKPATPVFNYRTLVAPSGKVAHFIWHYGAHDRGSAFAMGLDATALELWHPIEDGKLGWLRIESDVADSRAAALLLIREHVLLACFAIVLSALALFRLLHPKLRALAAATDFARGLTQTGGQQIPVFSGCTELAELGQALNQTSLRLHAQEHALHASMDQLQAMFNNVMDGIVTWDSAGRIDSANPAANAIFGYASTSLVGQPIQSLVHASEAGTVTTTTQQISVGLHADGTAFPLEISISRFMLNGRQHTMGLLRDITERNRIERLKSEFVSTVSHELRTPLTSIFGALGLITGGALGEMPEQARQMIDIAHKNSLRLTHLINDLLDMEKLVAGKMQFDLRVQALMPLVEHALEISRPYGAARHVRLSLTAATPGVEVCVDSHRLTQVFSNLLSNACKYSPENGVVAIAVEQRGEWLRITFTDNGPGIPAAFRPRIFEKFSQADSSDTRQKGGTGLGLAISREIVEKMGGEIGFESEEGEGARFFVQLSAHPQSA